jgi:hypothetical protein
MSRRERVALDFDPVASASVRLTAMKPLPLLTITVIAAGCLYGCCSPCGSREPVRPVDRACLPAGTSPAEIPLYRGDVEARYRVIATIDSFACSQCETKDGIEPEVIQEMMRDLQEKARAAGADALIRVKLLSNKVSGFKENPRTPFWSVMQGQWEEPFFRGVAIKYEQPMAGEPRAIPERTPGPLPVLPQDRPLPVRAGTLPIDPLAVPQPVHPQVEAPRR